MYVCQNCGEAFEGRVCPRCCAMRPTAAVLGRAGQIVKNRAASRLDPSRQAEQLAEELEYSRKVDAWRKEQQRKEEENRQRAAQLAEAAARQNAIPRSVETEEEQEQHAPQPKIPSDWQRKAPLSRGSSEEEQEVEVPDALRSLRISGTESRKPPSPPAAGTPRTETQVRSTVSAEEADDVRRLVYPAGGNIPGRKAGDIGRVSARSQQIDDAWRAFASGEKAAGDRTALPDLASGKKAQSVPAPPPPPGRRNGE